MPSIYKNIRPPSVAGQFYPADANALKKQISEFINNAPAPADGKKAIAVMSPHAGYIYSGQISAVAINAVKNTDFQSVFLIGSSHRKNVKDIALASYSAFRTPLGDVPVNAEANKKLIKLSPLFHYDDKAHENEHSLETQIPFLQGIKKEFSIIPILINTEDDKIIETAAKFIAEICKEEKAIIVISTDLSHYPDYETANKADKSLLKALSIAADYKDMSYFTLAKENLEKSAGYDTAICGYPALILGTKTAMILGAEKFETLKYANSGDSAYGDKNSVVGYGAGVFGKEKNKMPAFDFSADEKSELLKTARESIKAGLLGKKLNASLSIYPALNVPAAVFVTLTIDGELRGCIGTLKAEEMVKDAVSKYALSAAFDDPRFPPLSDKELDKVKIEISVLSPLMRASIDDIVPDKHGVYVKQGFRSGTYLPQVWEHFKSKKDFLESLVYEKAGLPKGALTDKNTEFFVYTVESFEE